jgi:hypothetical protein
MIALWLIGLVGCSHYWIDERAFAAYAKVPVAARKRVVVAANRVSDGGATLIRMSEARPEDGSDGKRRQVRVLRPITTSGLVLIVTGAAWLGVGLGVLFGQSHACVESDSCAGIAETVGFTAIAAAGVELPIGLILSGIGARTSEVGVVGGRFREVQP